MKKSLNKKLTNLTRRNFSISLKILFYYCIWLDVVK